MKITTSIGATAVVCAVLYVQTTATLAEGLGQRVSLLTDRAVLLELGTEGAISFTDETQSIVASITRPDVSDLVRQAAAEAAEDGWDGPGTQGVAAETLERALRVSLMLPLLLPEPDVSATPSGSISFDWYKGTSSLFSILVPRTGGVSYAAHLSGDRLNGALRLGPDRLPDEILAAANRWIGA